MTAIDPIAESAEAEAQLIGMCLQGVPLPDELPPISEAHWANPIHAVLWSAIVKAHGAGRRVPTTSQLVSETSGKVGEVGRAKLSQYLDSCVQTAPIMAPRGLAIAISEQARIIRGLSHKRALRLMAGELGRLADDPALTAPEAIAKVDRELSKLRGGELLAPVTLRQLVVQLVDVMELPSSAMPTGLDSLNKATAGGLWLGKLYGIAARMKMGKTVTLATVARNIARQGHKTLYLALEMGQSEVAQRVVADRLQINAVRFLCRDDPMLPERLIGYASRNDAPELDNLLFHDCPSCSFDQLKAICQQAVTQHDVRLIVLDYWQLVQGAQRGQTETQHLAYVAQWLADFARSANVAILTAAQINRDGQTRGSDGLRLACDWYAHLHPTEGRPDTDRWLEVLDSRYTVRMDLGSEQETALYIDNIGPVLREIR